MPNPSSTLICAAIGLLSLLAATPARAAVEESTRIGGIDVVVWTPSAGGQRHLPVLLFSHALYLCPTQSRYHVLVSDRFDGCAHSAYETA